MLWMMLWNHPHGSSPDNWLSCCSAKISRLVDEGRLLKKVSKISFCNNCTFREALSCIFCKWNLICSQLEALWLNWTGVTQNWVEFHSQFSITCYFISINWSPIHLMAVFSPCISSWISSSIRAWVAHIVWASLVQFWIKLCVWIKVCKATAVTAAAVQIAINPQMPRIIHPVNRLDCQSNLVSNWEASPAMGTSSQGRWRFTGNHITSRLKNQKGFIS